MMNISHVAALSLTFIIYITLSVAYLGWGKVTTYLLGLDGKETLFLIPFIWVGWALTLFIFQLIHFFLPLTAFVVIPVLVVGVILAIPQIVTALRHSNNPPSRHYRVVSLGIIAALFAVTCWIASRSMLPPINFDSGLYHFNKIRWINAFPIVPGLGNLHGRLAFNQSFFTYAAALNFYPFFGHGRSIANSFLLLLTIATFIALLRPVLKEPSLLVESHPFQYASIIITLPILGYLAFSSNGLNSPSPDLTSTILHLIMIVVLAQGLSEMKSGKTDQNYRAIFLAILAITAVTIKLSNLAFSVAILGFILFYARKPHATPVVVRIIVLATIMIVVWCLQSVILSGAPLYPSTIGYLPVEWAVPIEKVVDEANWVYSWARQPHTHWSIVLGNWNWLEPWLVRNIKEVSLFFLSLLLCTITMAVGLFKKESRLQYWEWAILLPSIIGLIYWFITAPSPRFAYGLFFTTLICAILLFLSSIRNVINRRMFFVVICVFFVATNVFTANAIRDGLDIKSISLSGWYPVKSAQLDKMVTASGLLLYVPKTMDQSWDSPLPSTPYFNDLLRLRNPENMSSGFTSVRQHLIVAGTKCHPLV